MITSTRLGGIDAVVLDRPAKRNALTLPLWRDLTAAIRRLGRLRHGGPVLLRGAGGYFCAGADLDTLATARTNGEAAREFAETLVGAFLSVDESPRPVVSLVETGAAGGGVELMLACRARVAIGSVQLIFPFGDRGVVPDVFTASRLAHLVGPEAAAHLVTGTHRMSGEEALSLGLLDAIVPDLDTAVLAGIDLAHARPRQVGEQALDPGRVARTAEPMIASLISRRW